IDVTNAITLTPVGNLTSVVGRSVVLPLTAADLSGNAVRYEAAQLPPGLTINAGSGVITGTLTTAGSYAVTVTATDVVTNLSATWTFSWTVVDVVTGRVHFIQANSQSLSGAVQTVSVPFVSPQLAGDLNVAVVAWQGASGAQVASVVDAAGNVYQL